MELGLSCWTSADGRLHGELVATNLSPNPVPVDFSLENASEQEVQLSKVLATLAHKSSFGSSNDSPFDVKVREDFGVARLRKVLEDFFNGTGTNILNVTTANWETFVQAINSPDPCDLLRVQMGG